MFIPTLIHATRSHWKYSPMVHLLLPRKLRKLIPLISGKSDPFRVGGMDFFLEPHNNKLVLTYN